MHARNPTFFLQRMLSFQLQQAFPATWPSPPLAWLPCPASTSNPCSLAISSFNQASLLFALVSKALSLATSPSTSVSRPLSNAASSLASMIDFINFATSSFHQDTSFFNLVTSTCTSLTYICFVTRLLMTFSFWFFLMIN